MQQNYGHNFLRENYNRGSPLTNFSERLTSSSLNYINQGFGKKYEQNIYQKELKRKILFNNKLTVTDPFLESYPYEFKDLSENIHNRITNIQYECSKNILNENKENSKFFNQLNLIKENQNTKLHKENKALKKQLKGLKSLILQYDQQMNRIKENCKQNREKHQKQKYVQQIIELDKEITILLEQQKLKDMQIEDLSAENSKLQAILCSFQHKLEQRSLTNQLKMTTMKIMTSSSGTQSNTRIQVLPSALTLKSTDQLFRLKNQKQLRRYKYIKKYMRGQLVKLKQQYRQFSIRIKKELLVFLKLFTLQIYEAFNGKPCHYPFLEKKENQSLLP